MKFVNNNISILFLLVLLVLTVSTSYYKFIVLGDFNSLFYVTCTGDTTECYVNTDSCAEGDDISECGYYYEAYVINQGEIDNVCTPDDGSCVKSFCSNSGLCTIVVCDSDKSSYYGLTDSCSE